ncbi:hypothetical protein RND71_012183 [Anisodus tanguticus]|uniref:non-specific serine/threonine protein kinase n=1 Tax=Anisodus tanguticus TaxID=243964 RepID=A0AAE1SGI1_9SOLA|nr:hypothetical protein RND71_012183 [Anisodus tanguticus]
MSTKSAKTEKKGTILLHKYEIGKLLGQGTFAKVYHARNLKTGKNVAVKVIDKEKVTKIGLIDQIKREISVMRLIRQPNVVELYEVMASKTKIYFAMEYVRGGELFNKVAKGRLRESVARKYFQQLIAAVDFCHSRGVYHRDPPGRNRKPKGLRFRPECTFRDEKTRGDMMAKRRIFVKKLLSRILDPNPISRITLAKLMDNHWFKKGFKQIDKTLILDQSQDDSPRSVFDIVDDLDAECSSGHKDQSSSTMKPACLNAFDIISLSPGFDLFSLFEKDKSHRLDARFTTQKSASTIISRLEEVASMESFKV